MTTCRVCGNAPGNTRHRAREMLIGLRDEFEYFQCAACECLQIAQVPDDLHRYYPGDYYAFAPMEWEAPARFVTFLRRARTRYQLGGGSLLGAFLTRLSGPADLPEYILPADLRIDDRILDVGCGSGRLLRALAEQGFTSLTGIDPFIPGDVDAPNGVRIRRKRLEETTGEFDCIILNHAFEHMPDPRDAFRLLDQRLAAGGVIIIRIPVVPSLAWDMYGVDWLQLDAPRHLFLHSAESMRILSASRGMRVTRIVYDSDARQFWGSEQYRRDIPHRSPKSFQVDPASSVFSADEIAAYEARARTLNLEGRGDQASFYIRRDSDAALVRRRETGAERSRADTGADKLSRPDNITRGSDVAAPGPFS